MSLDLRRQFIAQLVESSRLLRNYIDHRAKSRGTTRAQWIVLFRLRQQDFTVHRTADGSTPDWPIQFGPQHATEPSLRIAQLSS